MFLVFSKYPEHISQASYHLKIFYTVNCKNSSTKNCNNYENRGFYDTVAILASRLFVYRNAQKQNIVTRFAAPTLQYPQHVILRLS